jgi:hypothetical protein
MQSLYRKFTRKVLWKKKNSKFLVSRKSLGEARKDLSASGAGRAPPRAPAPPARRRPQQRRRGPRSAEAPAARRAQDYRAALAAEDYGAAARLRDAGGLGLAGWWHARSEADPCGHLLRVAPDFGRLSGLMYTSRDLAELKARALRAWPGRLLRAAQTWSPPPVCLPRKPQCEPISARRVRPVSLHRSCQSRGPGLARGRLDARPAAQRPAAPRRAGRTSRAPLPRS